jgi:FMN-dependent NADH-azoreductase
MTQTNVPAITEISTAEPALRVLHVDASSRGSDSVTRQLGARFIETLRQQHGNVHVTRRDTALGLPLIDAKWIGANFTPAPQRTAEQHNALALSDALVDELQQADILVIGSPLYNFSVPAALKAWIDLVARAGLTFRYTENGPQGLLSNKKAYVIIATGGTTVGSDIDFASGYLRHVLGFLGINDASIIPAERLNTNREDTLEKVGQTIKESVSALHQQITHAA